MADEQPEPRPPVGVALDADLATRADALLAVAGLNGFAAKSEARRISLSVSRPSLTAARLADVQQWLRAIGAPNDCSGEHLFFWQDEIGIRSGTCTAGPNERGSTTSSLKFRLEQRVVGTTTEELVVAVETL